MCAGLHFLVVDDIPVMRFKVVVLLKNLGYVTVSEAENGQQALQLLHAACVPSLQINFIVTDRSMPVMDGLALLQAIRAHAEFRHLPVLMVTGDEEKENVATAIRAGADGYILKSTLNGEILKRALHTILQRRGLAM